jgi:hypothetical protein
MKTKGYTYVHTAAGQSNSTVGFHTVTHNNAAL